MFINKFFIEGSANIGFSNDHPGVYTYMKPNNIQFHFLPTGDLNS